MVGQFEWAGEGLHTVFAQPANLFSPSHWRMIYDVLRFGDEATSILGTIVSCLTIKERKNMKR